MCERSFLRDLRPFEKEEKKRKEKVQKFQSGIFGLFWTPMASRLSGIASTNISRHPFQKKRQKSIKHYKFLIFDEKQLPQKFSSTYLQISLVPCINTKRIKYDTNYLF